MFSKPKPDETVAAARRRRRRAAAPSGGVSVFRQPSARPRRCRPRRSRSRPPSVLSSDLTILGNVRSSGDIQVEGIVEGDVRAQMLIVGETATVKGEVVAEEVVVHGRVVGRLRGLKVRLSALRPLRGRHRPQDDRDRERRPLRGLGPAPGRPARQEQGARRPRGRVAGDDRRRVAAAGIGGLRIRSPAPSGGAPLVQAGRDHLAIEVPGGVAEDRQRDDEPEEERQHRNEEQCRRRSTPSAASAAGCRVTAWKLATIAVTQSTSRSTSIGSETTVSAKSRKAITPPTIVPTTTSAMPLPLARIVSRSRRRRGGRGRGSPASPPSTSTGKSRASTTKAIDGIWLSRLRQTAPSTSAQSRAAPASRRRLTS